MESCVILVQSNHNKIDVLCRYVYDVLPMSLTLIRNVRNNTETDAAFISCTAYETTKSANSLNHMSE